MQAFGDVQVVVNNAGNLRDRMFVNMSEEEWDQVMQVHLKGHFCLANLLAKRWRDQSKAGQTVDARIINTSSGAGLQGSVTQSNYSAAKAGIAALTLVQAVELKRYGITANAFAPSARKNRPIRRVHLKGWRAFSDVKRRLRDALRPAGPDDLWIGRAPGREELERRLHNDDEARKVLFEWSMVQYVEHFLSDHRLQSAYLGQGVIGTFASPHDPGTASIHFHHQSGRQGGTPGMWGYVHGGMGMPSLGRYSGCFMRERYVLSNETGVDKPFFSNRSIHKTTLMN